MADILGGLVSAGINYFNQERAFGQQKELQSDAQKYNTLMWNLNNQYNSAAAQMARFQSAGLNPNLIYGQMSNGLSAPSIGAGSAPSPAQAPAMSALETAQIGLIDAQRENIEADTALKDSSVGLNDATIEKFGIENNWTKEKIEETKAAVAKVNEEIKSIKLDRVKVRNEIKLLQSQKHLTEWQAVNAQIDAFWANDRNKALVDNLCSQTGLNNAQAKEILTLIYAKLANIKSSTALNTAQKNAASALKRLYQSQKEGQDISNTQAVEMFDKQMKQLDNVISKSNVEADLYEDWPLLMKTMQVFGPILGQAVPLIGAGIIRGGMTKSAALKSSNSYSFSPNVPSTFGSNYYINY